MTSIQTDRLLIRPIKPTDHDALQAMLLDPKVVAYLRYQVLKTPADFDESFQQHFLKDQHTTFGIETKQDHQLIGFYEFHPENRVGILTYALATSAWGHGYMAEAGRAMLAYGFETLELDALEAHYHVDNPNSGRVMAKMGMQYQGSMDFTTPDGRQFEVLTYRLTKKDWLESQSKSA